MSFNVNGIKNTVKTNETYAKNISAVVKESLADIVLMQEFYIKQDEAELFCGRLGANWQYFSTKDYIKHNFEKWEAQNNIIFYNNTKILPTYNKDSGIVNFKTDNKYGFVKNHTQVVEFCISGQPSKSFVVVNVHLPLYVKSYSQQKLVDYRHDLKSLEALYSDLDSKGYKLIIGGDFNTKRFRSSGNDAGEIMLYRNIWSREERFPGAIVDSDSQLYCHPIYYGLFTNHFDKNREAISPTLDIDHFVIRNLKVLKDTCLYLGQNHRENSNKHSPYVFKVGSKNCERDYYMKHVSDHLPIMIELEL